MGVGVNCQGIAGNAGECQGNALEWKQSASGTHGNAGENKGIPGNARGTYGSGCKVPGECNAGECQGNIWEWVYSATGKQGTTRVMQGSGCKVLAE